MRTTASCIDCGARGRTHRDPTAFRCRTCADDRRHARRLRDYHDERPLTGGEWVRDGLIWRWIPQLSTGAVERPSRDHRPPQDHRNTDEKDAA